MLSSCTSVTLLVLLSTQYAFSQQRDSLTVVRDSTAAINVTNKGISLVRKTATSPVTGHFVGAVSVTKNGISLIPTRLEALQLKVLVQQLLP